MKMTNPVRVRVGDQTTTVEAAYAESKGLEVVEERAVDKSGRSLPASGQGQAAQVAAAIDDDIAGLKGSALTDALDAAGLAKGGNADAKRARLAEHRANAANLTPDPSPDGSGSEDSTEGTDQ